MPLEVGQPDGYQPDGYHYDPGASGGDDSAEAIRLSELLRVKAAADEVWYFFDWAELLEDVADGVDLSSVAYTLPSPLTNAGEVEAFGSSHSRVKIGAGAHAGLYSILAVATLSNAEVLELEGTLRVFN